MRMVHNKVRVTKRHWYAAGGFKASDCFRKHDGRSWTYWISYGYAG